MTKQDKAFEELEGKIGAKTIDIRPEMEEKRKWFFDTEGWMADDETVIKAWEERQ